MMLWCWPPEMLFAGGGEGDGSERRGFRSWPKASHHLLGTDGVGRDVLARVVVGGQGVIDGRRAVRARRRSVRHADGTGRGYFGSLWDTVLMRWADVQLALPFILVAITFTAILGADLWKLIGFMVITQWVQYARVMRAQVLGLRDREFVLAARGFGVGDAAIMGVHILPNGFGPVLVLMTLNVANNILLESSLTFLGLGIDPTTPSWGGMLADGRTYLQTAWWVSLFPGLAIMLTVLGPESAGRTGCAIFSIHGQRCRHDIAAAETRIERTLPALVARFSDGSWRRCAA